MAIALRASALVVTAVRPWRYTPRLAARSSSSSAETSAASRTYCSACKLIAWAGSLSHSDHRTLLSPTVLENGVLLSLQDYAWWLVKNYWSEVQRNERPVSKWPLWDSRMFSRRVVLRCFISVTYERSEGAVGLSHSGRVSRGGIPRPEPCLRHENSSLSDLRLTPHANRPCFVRCGHLPHVLGVDYPPTIVGASANTFSPRQCHRSRGPRHGFLARNQRSSLCSV